MLKKALTATYIIIVAVMMAATAADKLLGTGFADAHIYSSWWFAFVWALLAAAAIAYMISRRMKSPALIALHAALIIILAGALVTRLTATRGMLHLRQGQTATAFIADDGRPVTLPFNITLQDFQVVPYPGTDTPMDYVSRVLIGDADTATISMNNIASPHGYRLYQTSYDPDGGGTILSVSHDPAGIGITYAGYALLFLSLLLILILPGEAFRRNLRTLRGMSNPEPDTTDDHAEEHMASESSMLMTFLLALALSAIPQTADAQRLETRPYVENAMPTDAAEAYGNLMCYYGGRVCPLQTVARDFTLKIYGRDNYMGLSAEQVLMGWTLDAPRWTQEKMIRIKKNVAHELGLRETLATYAELVGADISGRAANHRRQGNTTTARALEEADEKVAIVRMLFAGQMLKVFPLPDSTGHIGWYSPADELPACTGDTVATFVRRIFSVTIDALAHQDTARMELVARQIAGFQRIAISNAGGVEAGIVPSAGRLKAEKACNNMSVTRPLAMAMTAMGIIFFFVVTYLWGRGVTSRAMRMFTSSMSVLLGIVGAYLLVMFCLRWYAGAHLPLSNGQETMNFMSLCVIALSLVATRRFALALPFGYLMAGLTLMVSMFGESNPQVTNLMPVLSSPLLSVHVCLMMVAYTLLAFMALNGLSGLVMPHVVREQEAAEKRVAVLAAVSRAVLVPAVAFLAAGIFVGAIWANQSWGRYWGWDPKEVWALITMMIYAIPLHTSVARALARPRALHIFLLVAFACVLMTYFGVNFLLGGMHSYA